MPDLPEDDDSIGFEDDAVRQVFYGPVGSGLRSPEQLAAEFPLQRRDLLCPDCGAKLVLKDGRYGIFYACEKWNETSCRGSHNCNKRTAEPLGVPADGATRRLRMETHEILDQLWKSGRMSRNETYQWLSKVMGMVDAHVGKFNDDDCRRAIKLCRKKLGIETRFDRINEEDII